MAPPVNSCDDQIPYVPLVEGLDGKEQRRERRRSNSVRLPIVLFLFFIGALLAVGLCHYFGCSFSSSNRQLTSSLSSLILRGDEHTIPTLLSVVDPKTGRYLYALDRPLYARFRNALRHKEEYTFLRRESSAKTAAAPRLHLDRSETTIRQPLTLSWTSEENNGSLLKDDYILSLHCPHDSPHAVFQDIATLAQARATSIRHGRGSYNGNSWYFPEFPVVRHETCQFRLFQVSAAAANDGDNHHDRVQLLALSPILKIRDSPRTPTGIHLAFTNDTTTMVVQFTTGDEGTPVAMYGMNGTNDETTKVEGTSHTYGATDMCQEPANITEAGKFQDPGMLHVVTLTNLQPDTDYQYKVGLAGGQGIVWSDTFHFHSAPTVGDNQEFSYVVYGDQGCPSVGWGDGGLWTSAMAAREASTVRAVHHFGDLSYARGAAHIWDEWFHMIQSFAGQVPLLIGVGNHEYDHTAGGENGKDPSGLNASRGFNPEWGNYGEDSGGECGVPTSQRFTMPASNGSNGVFWYSHEHATVHTAFISSEHNMTKGSPQYEWLAADLLAVNRTRTPWVVVESHRPMYESEAFFDQTAVCIGIRDQIEDLLYERGVDLFLAGHYHMYQRTCDGLYRTKCNSGGPMHITIGSAGASLDTGLFYPQEWTAYSIQGEYGYGRITIVNASALHWEFVKAGAENDTDAGSVRDHVWITRQR